MFSENLNIVKKNISDALNQTGKSINDIKLVAVSKTKPVEIILEAYNLGLRDFGENKAKELKAKSAELPKDIHWHFIGHLQRNKVKEVIPVAELIHSVDSIKIAGEINKRANAIGKVQKILIEVNTSEEETKFGLSTVEQVNEVAHFCNEASNLNLCGLMTMAPFTGNEKILRNCFIKLREMKENLNSNGFNLKELSMGMTNDYEIAIEEGATIVRIGTALFGKRNY
ncbi:hypothetical protein BMS3Abin04_02563 [bacterium BMS3Abin04]|nr:hypothetical protein BMS3Abin04_02563 [bacterium BMS3Abin04]